MWRGNWVGLGPTWRALRRTLAAISHSSSARERPFAAAKTRLELIKAAESVRAILEDAVSDINSQPHLTVTWANEGPFTVDKDSEDYDLALRLELKKLELTVISESSYYRGRSED